MLDGYSALLSNDLARMDQDLLTDEDGEGSIIEDGGLLESGPTSGDSGEASSKDGLTISPIDTMMASNSAPRSSDPESAILPFTPQGTDYGRAHLPTFGEPAKDISPVATEEPIIPVAPRTSGRTRSARPQQSYYEAPDPDDLPAKPSTSSIQIPRKRKREASEGIESSPIGHVRRKSATTSPDLSQVRTDIQETQTALGSSVNHHLVTTLWPRLHSIFVFTASSASGGARTEEEKEMLDQLGRLLQLLGVLLKIEIPLSNHQLTDETASNASQVEPSQVLAGQAVHALIFPCTHMSCPKVFSNSRDRSKHQKVHNSKRPFRCPSCTASFTRNHDLQRHARCHTTEAYQCTACKHTFSRRDAFKRHKENSKNAATCGSATCKVVDSPETRRVSKVATSPPEDGELNTEVFMLALGELKDLHTAMRESVWDLLQVEDQKQEAGEEIKEEDEASPFADIFVDRDDSSGPVMNKMLLADRLAKESVNVVSDALEAGSF